MSDKATNFVLATMLLVAAGTVSACGPGDFVDETWMLGTFSCHDPGCDTRGFVTRYVVHDDGGFDIVDEDYNGTIDRQWHALWEQDEAGRFRVLRDSAHADAEFYPIDEGTEWEVVRGMECDAGWRRGRWAETAMIESPRSRHTHFAPPGLGGRDVRARKPAGVVERQHDIFGA